MKTVHDLTQDELEELRSCWFSQHEDDGSLNEVMDMDEDVEINEEDVPMDTVKSYYEDTFFVDDDFFCSKYS
jgi:hypothetical protein